jgi:hypothetical protein
VGTLIEKNQICEEITMSLLFSVELNCNHSEKKKGKDKGHVPISTCCLEYMHSITVTV